MHGTWAAPDLAKRRWYQPVDGVPATEGFVSKLDAALQKRGSPARCWAHCTGGNEIFHWSGDNSWIARTLAASMLGEYVAKLRKEGWRCHIVAHSHGGNVVVEALPEIMSVPDPNKPLGKIVTLGTPFMDTMSPIIKRARRARRILNIVSWMGFATVMAGLALFIYLSVAMSGETVVEYFSYWRHDLVLLIFFLPIMLLVLQWLGRTSQTGQGYLAQAQPPFLAIGSLMDEAWQILHHTRTIQNPLAVSSNLLSYLFSCLRSNISQNAQVARIRGAKSYRDIGTVAKLVMAITHLVTFVVVLFIGFLLLDFFSGEFHEFDWMSENFKSHPTLTAFLASAFYLTVILAFVLFLTKLLGETFYSAFLSPFRWCKLHAASLGSIVPEVVTYVVRDQGWSVLQAMAMGLEGYRFEVPFIEQHPSYAPQNFVKYENMPTGAEQHALDKRSAWVARHLGDVSQTFSKLAVTAADLTALLRTVEEDQTLVHAAYYTDDECIARIADWIAGRG